jgi:peptidoglycan pentaglycine glycine transferase (the first glycine)
MAAVILVRFGDRVIYMYGASRNEARERMPNHLLQWEAIRWARAQGCRVYDFWGAPDEFEESTGCGACGASRPASTARWCVLSARGITPARPLLYRLYTQAIPRYLNMLRAAGRASHRPGIIARAKGEELRLFALGLREI